MKKLLILFAGILLAGCSKDNTPEREQNPVISSISINGNGDVYNNNSTIIKAVIEENDNVLSSVDFYIDGKLAKSIFSKPYEYKDVLKDLKTGDHSVEVIVNCSNGQKVQKTANFKFKVALGDEYQGGIIIKLDDNGLNGIIASKSDLQGGVVGKFKYGAYNGNYGAFSMDDGLSNTDKFKGKFDSDYAAIACLNLEYNGYNDWYLPAYNQLALFENFLDKLTIPERSGYKYWSSTGSERDNTKAYIYGFGVSVGNPFDMQTYCMVRPCRNF